MSGGLDALDAAIDAVSDDEAPAPVQRPRDPIDPLDAAIDQVDAGNRNALNLSARQAVDVNPDQFAEAKRIGEASGLPADLVHRQFDEERKRFQVQGLGDLYDRSPVLARQFANPAFAKLSHDDVDALAGIEETWKTEGFAGASRVQRRVEGALRKPDFATGEAGATDFDFEAQERYADASWLRRGIAKGSAQIAGAEAGLLQAGAHGLQALFGEAAGSDLDQFASQIYGHTQRFQQGVGTSPETFQRNVEGAIQSITFQLPGLATGNVTGALSAMFLGTFGDEYAHGIGAGLAGQEAAERAAIYGTFEVLGEKLGIGKLMQAFRGATRGVPAKDLAKQFLAYQVRDLAGEQFTTAGEFLTDKLAPFGLNQEATLEEYLQQATDTLYQTVIQGGILTGAGLGTSAVARNLGRRQDATAEAERSSELLQRLSDLANASHLAERSPVDFQAYVDAVAAESRGTAPTEVFVDGQQFADALNQSGITPEQLAAASPATAAQLGEAISTGGTVRIGVGDFAANLARSDLGAALLPHLRAAPDALSQNEAKTEVERLTQQFESDAKAAAAESEQDATFQTSAEAVRAIYEQQLAQANRFTPEVNRAYSSFISSFFATQARRLGITPEELQKRFPLQIRADAIAAPALNQGLRLFHVSQSEDLAGELTFEPRETKQGKTGKYGGLYAYDNEADVAKFRSGNQASFEGGSHVYEINLAAGARVFEMPERGAIERLSAEKLAELREQGYAVVRGKSTLGKTEYAVIDQAGVQSINRQGGTLQQDTNTALQGEIRGLLAAAAEQGNRSEKVTVGEVADWLVEAARAVGLEIEGYQHSIDASAVRHVRNQHSDETAEAQRGQLAVTDDDFLRIPEIVTNPDYLVLGTRSRRHDQVGYVKTMPDGTILYLEEVRSGRKNLAAQSLRKYPATMNVDSVLSTLDPNARSDGGNALTVVEAPAADNLNQADGARGAFSPSANVVSLFQGADLSTTLHELGHFYLEVLNSLALQPGAPAAIVEDMQKALKWMGVESIEAWNALDLEGKRPYHEQFARGFEAYLFEGKAPVPELTGLFQRFRAWMLQVYQTLSALNVQLDPEIRGVFDRLVASDEAIREAEAARAYAPIFTEKPEGMTDEEFRAYQELFPAATGQAQAELGARSLQDLKWADGARARVIRALQKEAAARRKAVRAEVTAQVRAEPVYAALRFLRRGEVTADGEEIQVEQGSKLQIGALEQLYANQDGAPDWRSLGTGKYGALGHEGLPPDVVAEIFGFTSGDHLVRELVAARPEDEVISERTDRAMLERFGDLTSPERLQHAANEAIHNELRAKAIAAELRALQRANAVRGQTRGGGTVNLIVEAAKAAAKALIARKRIRDIRPTQYAAAETRAAQAALEALQPRAAKGRKKGADGKMSAPTQAARKTGDLGEAVGHKRNQVLNHHLEREATEALAEVEKGVRYLRRVAESESIDRDYRDQIAALLDRYDLRRISNKQADRRKSLSEWVEQQRAMGFDPAIADELLNEARRVPYRDLTTEQFRGLVDAVKNIEHLGRLKHKLLTARDKKAFEAVAAEIVEAITSNAKGTRDEVRETNREVLVRAGAIFRGAIEFHRTFASQVHQMDGFTEGGVLWERFVRGMNEAGDQEVSARREATKALTAILQPLLGESMGGRRFYPELGKSLSREERIGMALNTGNEINLERLMTGEKLSAGQVRFLLDTLTREEMDAVQAVWDYLDSFRPKISAKEERIGGVRSQWVEAAPIQTKHGTFRGGYWPISYDRGLSTRSAAHDAAAVAEQLRPGSYTSKTTRRGHLKERVESTGRTLRYDFGGILVDHVNQVIHDLAWHEYLIDANRLMAHKGIDQAIRDHYGPERLKAMRELLGDIAGGAVSQTNGFLRLLAHLRAGTVIAGLGLNIFNTLQNLTGITQSMAVVGSKWILKGAAHWIGDAARLESSVTKMHAMSSQMRNRHLTMNREVGELRNKIEAAATGSALGKLRQLHGKMLPAFFYLQMKTQLLVDVPTWYGAREKAMAQDGMTPEKAIALADQAVLDAQGGGQIKDLAKVMRGTGAAGEALKLFTVFGGYFNRTFNATATAIGRTNFRKAGDIALLSADLALLYAVPALLTTLLRGLLSGSDDEPEDVAKEAIGEGISMLFATIVGLREFGGVGHLMLGTDRAFDYSGPAGTRPLNSLWQLIKQANQGEADAAFWKALGTTLGTLFHLPAGQLNRTVEGSLALSGGETDNPGAVIMGPPH